MLRALLLALSLTTPLSHAAECNCIVIPDATGKHQIKCDVPSIIVFTNTMPTVTPALTSVPYITTPQPVVKPVTPTPKPTVIKPTTTPAQGGTVGYDPITNQWIWK